MLEMLFIFVYALTSARSSGFDGWLSSFAFVHRIVLKVATPPKEPDQRTTTGTKTKSLFKDRVARKPYPILWHLHITITWNYLTEGKDLPPPLPSGKIPFFPKGRGGLYTGEGECYMGGKLNPT